MNYQSKIIDFSRSGESFLIQALAGSGKSTTLRKIYADDPRQSTLYVAFNKHNIADMTAKGYRGIAMGAHSLGYQRISRAIRKKLTVNQDKSLSLLKACGIKLKDTIGFQQAWAGFRLLGGGADPLEYNDIWSRVSDLVDTRIDEFQHHTSQLVEKNLLMVRQGVVDFEDMLWAVPHVVQPRSLQYQRVMLDECQDLSPAMIQMMKHLVRPDSQVIAVGDPHQAIFEWAFAGVDNFPTLAKTFDAYTTLTLPMSYRCPSMVTSEAQEYVPEILPYREGGDVTSVAQLPAELPKGALVISYKYKFLLEEFVRRKLRGDSVKLTGLNFVEQVARELQKSPGHDLQTDLANLSVKFIDKLAKIPITNGTTDKRQQLQNKIDVIKLLIETEIDYATLRKVIVAINNTKEADVTFSSIHRSKGTESPYVYILGHSNHRQDILEMGGCKFPSAVQKSMYVAITRSSDQLVYLP
jgi:hypothetical protein